MSSWEKGGPGGKHKRGYLTAEQEEQARFHGRQGRGAMRIEKYQKMLDAVERQMELIKIAGGPGQPVIKEKTRFVGDVPEVEEVFVPASLEEFIPKGLTLDEVHASLKVRSQREEQDSG